MTLTVDTLPAWLLGAGLIAPDEILYHELEVADAARRNRSLRVTSTGAANFLVKQPVDPRAPAADALRREAAFLAFCHAEPAAASVGALLPRLRHADPARALLVVELWTDAAPLWERHEQAGPARFPAALAEALGGRVGALHRAFAPPALRGHPRLAFLPRDLPWALTVHRPSPELAAGAGPGALRVLEVAAAEEGIAARLEALVPAWRPETVIHGDVRLDNILVRGAGEGEDADLRLVDWELVQAGDRAWDVAAGFHEYLLWWILKLPAAPTVEAMVAAAPYPLPVLQPAVRAFWRGYRAAAEIGDAEAEALLARAVRFCGARLIQAAFEVSVSAPALPPHAVLLLQAAANLLAEPERARRELLGLGEEDA